MKAVAISNNDMVYLHWQVEEKIPGCLGFSVIRHDAKTNSKRALPAMVGFPSAKNAGKKFSDTDEWPVQKYSWKDLFAKRGGTYWYEIVPMIGKPGHLTPDTKVMRTNSVTLDPDHGNNSVFFNRGIISTQAVARSLPKNSKGLPSTGRLKNFIEDPKNALRARLVGDLEKGVVTLLERAKKEKGECYCALYELSDKDLIDHLKVLKNKVHIVLSNAGEDTNKGKGDGDKTNAAARHDLHKLKLDVQDRMLGKGHIGHNKFIVYVKNRVARAVLSGSTNWTPTGLCAQSNNAILIESKALAEEYLDYWKFLKNDTTTAKKDKTKLQGKSFRGRNQKKLPTQKLNPEQSKDNGIVRAWFSPNTPQKSVPRGKNKDGSAKLPPTPADLTEVFESIENAKQGVLFLAFIPGSPSIVSKLKEVYDAKVKDKKLFYLRGAATSSDPASIFRVDLYHRSSKSDANVRGVKDPPGAAKPNGSVSSVAGIFATFAKWEAEIYKIGHAVIHDKILVIDPFTDSSVVVTGSHNLGFKASYANDENMLVIRNDRSIAAAYAAHVLDVYEHYRWRWRLQQPIRDAFENLKRRNPKAKSVDLWQKAVKQAGPIVLRKAWHELQVTDKWQDFYVEHRDFLGAENNFWSTFGGVGLAEGRPRDPVA